MNSIKALKNDYMSLQRYYMNEWLTIKELSELASVSEQSIYQRFNNSLKKYSRIIKGKKYVNSKALEEVYNITLNKVEQEVEQDLNKSIKGLEQRIEDLERLLEEKNERIKDKDQTIDRLLNDNEYFKEELSKATDTLKSSKHSINVLEVEKTILIEQLKEEQNKTIWERIFRKKAQDPDESMAKN